MIDLHDFLERRSHIKKCVRIEHKKFCEVSRFHSGTSGVVCEESNFTEIFIPLYEINLKSALQLSHQGKSESSYESQPPSQRLCKTQSCQHPSPKQVNKWLNGTYLKDILIKRIVLYLRVKRDAADELYALWFVRLSEQIESLY